MSAAKKQKIAIVGGGIGGLTAAYLLREENDITLFEKSHRLGGNAYTHTTQDGEQIDMAVAAYSKLVSENFLTLMKQIGVKMVVRPADALLTVHNLDTDDGFYLTPLNLKGLMKQRFSLFTPSKARELYQSVIGSLTALKMLDQGKLAGRTVRETVAMIPQLREERLKLMMAPICLLSSMFWDEVMDGPAEYFFAKQKSFEFFTPRAQMWGLHYPANFTRSYVDRLSSFFPDDVVLNSKIKSVSRRDGQVTLRFEDRPDEVFDKIIFACNLDQSLALLEEPTKQEQELLGAWRYKEGLMVVHKDTTHFPARELCQSWTCMYNQWQGRPHFSITICNWRLCPGASRQSPWMATQHPNFEIKEELLDFQKWFRTPLYDFNSFKTIQELPSLNGVQNTYYCGSGFGYGLHNDAVTSGIEAAKALGASWEGVQLHGSAPKKTVINY